MRYSHVVEWDHVSEIFIYVVEWDPVSEVFIPYQLSILELILNYHVPDGF